MIVWMLIRIYVSNIDATVILDVIQWLLKGETDSLATDDKQYSPWIWLAEFLNPKSQKRQFSRIIINL